VKIHATGGSRGESSLSLTTEPPAGRGYRRWLPKVRAGWQWLTRRCRVGEPRRLRLFETLSLGEKRFVAIVEFENQRFLLGGTPNSLVLLAALPGSELGASALGEVRGAKAI
jgi:hypothetical protein